MKEIAGQVEADGIFDVVVLAVVSQTPNLRKIQGEIADGIGFKLDAQTGSGRPDFLVILDDLWERL